MGNDSVVFRRIGGRVVPVHVRGGSSNPGPAQRQATQQTPASRNASARSPAKDSKARKTFGATLLASGLGAAVYAGNKANDLTRLAAETERVARQRAGGLGQMNLFKSRGTEKLFKLSQKLHQRRNFALIAGTVIGGAAIEAGRRALVNTKKETPEQKAKNISQAGVLAGGVSALAYRRKIFPVEPIVKAVKYAFKRKNFQYAFKGI